LITFRYINYQINLKSFEWLRLQAIILFLLFKFRASKFLLNIYKVIRFCLKNKSSNIILSSFQWKYACRWYCNIKTFWCQWKKKLCKIWHKSQMKSIYLRSQCHIITTLHTKYDEAWRRPYKHWHISTVVYKWWHRADCKLSQFIKQQKIHFVNKHGCVTNFLAENNRWH
jgi:hypothetical protein